MGNSYMLELTEESLLGLKEADITLEQLIVLKLIEAQRQDLLDILDDSMRDECFWVKNYQGLLRKNYIRLSDNEQFFEIIK